MRSTQEPQSSIEQEQSDQQRRTVGATAAVLASTLAEAFPNAGNHRKAGRMMAEDMGKAGFTPGPWNSNTRIEEPTRGHRVSYVGADSAAGILAQVWKPAGGDDAETIANARLIAAAPALYAALQTLLANAEAVHSFGLPDSVPPLTAVCFSDAQTTARAALAKAGGGA